VLELARSAYTYHFLDGITAVPSCVCHDMIMRTEEQVSSFLIRISPYFISP